MIRTESGRMMRRDPWRYTRNSGLTTLGGTKSLENMHQPDKLKTNDYFPSIPTCFEPAQPQASSEEDVDEWLNEELSKHMTGHDKEDDEDALIDILKIVGVSFIAKEEGDILETLPYHQPSNVMADVGARINMMPKLLFEHLKLANLKKTSMVIEMGNMTKKAPLGIVENILVKIDKFLFYFDFVVIDTLKEPDKTILLGRPFLATIHAQIDVFRGEISVGVGNEKVKFDMNGEMCHSRVPLEKIYMTSSIQESEYFNPHEMENDDSPALEQRTFHYSEESVDTVDSSSDTFKVCEEDCEIWPTCNPDLSFCSGTTKYTDPYDLYHKSDSPLNDTLRINTYFPGISKAQPKKSRIRENSFEEWMKIKLGHTDISYFIRCMVFKEWVNEDFNFGVNIGRIKDDPYFRNFDVYKDEFDKEIEQLVNKYELKAGRKRYALEKVWEKCEKFHDSTKQWYDEGFEEEELWQNGIEEIHYTPPLAKNETFEV
ncbi:phospholipase-like protein [Tanacetum coccineum]